MFSLKLFGGASLTGPDGPLTGRAAQRHRLALLALLAGARAGRTRDSLVAFLWPESGIERARHSLSDSVYRLNRALGGSAILAEGDALRLNDAVISSDVASFDDALEAGAPEDAVRMYAGPFLDGFHVPDAAEFERWADSERDRLFRRYAAALESVAEARVERGDLTGAVAALRRLAAADPYNARVTLRLMETLAGAGNRGGALQHSRDYAARLREEFGTEPEPEVVALADRLTSAPPAVQPALASGARPSRRDSGRAHELRAGEVVRLRRPSLRMLLGAALLVVIPAGTWLIGASLTDPVERTGSLAGIAVLPFDDLSADGANQYFADGVTEDVLASLAGIADLRVIASPSVMRYRDTGKSIADVADELGVTYVLEGSVRREGERVRITAQLLDATAGAQLWAHSYDRQVEDIFAVQAEIATVIADALEAEITPAAARRIERAPTVDLVAYELYLRAREYARRYDSDAHDRAVDFLRRAIRRDPDFALAHAGLARAYVVDVWNYGADAAWVDSAVAEAERALRIEPDLADAHHALGGARMAAGHYAEAAASLERALELKPNDYRAVNNLGIVFFLTGRTDRAIRLWWRATRSDPAYAFLYRSNLTEGYQQIGLLAEAEASAAAALALAPDDPYALSNDALIGLLRGDTARAIEGAARIADLHGSDARALLSAGFLLLLAGRADSARAVLERSYAISPTAHIRKGHV
ncbi:MAG: BTAD domain-containing putative transcriptional regulator, partial [Longimicrobiales bacterium]